MYITHGFQLINFWFQNYLRTNLQKQNNGVIHEIVTCVIIIMKTKTQNFEYFNVNYRISPIMPVQELCIKNKLSGSCLTGVLPKPPLLISIHEMF